MTKRCHHEYETKPGYPDELLCQKCQSCWTITDYLDWDAKRLMTIPKGVRFAVVKRQAELIKSRQGISMNINTTKN